MEHFPRKIIRRPYESIMRASYGSRNKDDNTQIHALCLARGVRQQRLLGGNPMNKIYFCLLLSVLECLHNYATVMIVFFVFQLVFVSSKAFRIFLGDSCFDLAEKQKLLRPELQFLKITEATKNSEFYSRLIYKIPTLS